MPRETIRDICGTFDVIVGWSRDQDVQIAVEMRSPRTSNEPQNLHELVRLWEQTPGYVPGDPEHPAGPLGLWSTLDRNAINDLIRVLRRARDSAFGRDE